MRVTGDCLRDARDFVFAADFFIGLVDFFAALFRLAAGLDALFDAAFDALFALLLPRDAARFDAVDDLRRAFPPDDFDADAMIISLEEGTRQHCARFARNVEPDERQNHVSALISPSWTPKRARRARPRRVAESPSRCGLQSPSGGNSCQSCVVRELDSSLAPINSRRVCAPGKNGPTRPPFPSDQRHLHDKPGVLVSSATNSSALIYNDLRGPLPGLASL